MIFLTAALIVLLGLPVYSRAAPVYNPTTGHSYVTVYGPTWEQTEAQALALGGHLVTINDVAEQQWLGANFTGMFIIGFNDIASEGNWVWSSGEAVTYTKWAAGEPGDEDMAITFLNVSGSPDLWYSRSTSLAGSYNGIAEYCLNCGGGGSTRVPEPSTLLLLAPGLAGLAAWGKRLIGEKG